MAFLQQHQARAGAPGANGCAPSPSGRTRQLALEFSDATVPLSRDDMLVLAVPPGVAKDLVPDLTVPDEFRAIVNGHFKIPAPPADARLPSWA